MHYPSPASEDISILRAQLAEVNDDLGLQQVQIDTLLEQVASVTADCAQRVETLTRENAHLRSLFGEIRTVVREHERCHEDPDDVTFVVVKLLGSDAGLHSDDALQEAMQEARDAQEGEDEDKLEAANKARETAERERAAAGESVRSLERQLEFAETQLKLIAEADGLVADSAANLLRQQVQAKLDAAVALNAELVDDMRTIAARCATTLAAEPPKRDQAKPLRAVLTILQVLAETAAAAGAVVIPERAFARAIEVEIPASDRTPGILARLMVFARDDSAETVPLAVSVLAWEAFQDRLEQTLEELIDADREFDDSASSHEQPDHNEPSEQEP